MRAGARFRCPHVPCPRAMCPWVNRGGESGTTQGAGTSTRGSSGRGWRPQTGADHLHSPATGAAQTRGSPLPCEQPQKQSPGLLRAAGGGVFWGWVGWPPPRPPAPPSPHPPPSATTSFPLSPTLTPVPLHYPSNNLGPPSLIFFRASSPSFSFYSRRCLEESPLDASSS